MMSFPNSNSLPITNLAGCFSNTSATYKYYWFLAILEAVEEGKNNISKKELFSRMISIPWYTVNYFQLSFGKQDMLQRSISKIKEIEQIGIDVNKKEIVEVLFKSNQTDTLKELKYFNKQVPHWFLSPWFPKTSKIEIYNRSKSFGNNCLYALMDDHIEVNLNWLDYLKTNIKFLKDFCYWNLSIFLQTRNPSIPDIPGKLIKPPFRGSLNKQRNDFWNLIFQEKGSIDCIYSGERLTIDNYAVEHFIPYSFICHDLIWNLIPAGRSFNSTKSNRLPRMEEHFDSFFKLQKEAVEIISQKRPKNPFLLDYLTIYPNLENIGLLSNNFKKERFKENIQPLIVMASNNGFQFLT